MGTFRERSFQIDEEGHALIRPVLPSDAEAIARIYNHYILNTVVTFEEKTISAEQIAERLENVRTMSLPWLVAMEGDLVVGYAYAAKWQARSAFRLSVECTIYLSPNHLGQGLGTSLYRNLFASLRQNEAVHTVIGSIALPNGGSVALHEKFGLNKVAHFEEVGFKFNQWIDVGYWQVLLRSRLDDRSYGTE